MKLTLECIGVGLDQLLRALRAAASKDDYIFIIFDDDLILFRDTSYEFDHILAWVEIDVSERDEHALFSNILIKSKQPKNLIILKTLRMQLLEAIQASCTNPHTQVIIRLASKVDSEGNQGAYLEFKCTIPEENENFVYQKTVDAVVKQRPTEDLIPKEPNAIECDIVSLFHMQKIFKCLQNEEFSIKIGLTVEECPICRTGNNLEEDFVFQCDHNRPQSLVGDTGTLTVTTNETSPLQVTTTYCQVPLSKGHCTQYTTYTSLKGKHFAEVLQRACTLNWPKGTLGFEHEDSLTLTFSKDERLLLRMQVPSFIT